MCKETYLDLRVNRASLPMFTQVFEHRPANSANQDLAEWCSDGLYGVLLELEATSVIQAENYFTDVTMFALLGKIHIEGRTYIYQSQKKKKKKKKY